MGGLVWVRAWGRGGRGGVGRLLWSRVGGGRASLG